MANKLKRVAVTGGAGQIAYSLLFRIANGDLLGPEQPIALHILEVPEALNALEGVKMELQDCAFPLLKEIVIGSDPLQVFKGVDIALLVGAKPRGQGMERGDLLKDNGAIFTKQGEALNEVAHPDVKVLVVGNPCNTNCLIALSNAPKIPKKNFFAMTQLDQNRGVAQLAVKSGKDIGTITNFTIWGNHSSTQVPDFYHAKIEGKPVTEVIRDANWLQKDFIEAIQKRGAAIIAARGKSSAASAAQAAIDSIKNILTPTPKGHWFSIALHSEKNPYGIDENLIFSFPCRSKGNGEIEIIPDLDWNDFLKEKIDLTEKELLEEREFVAKLLDRQYVKS